MGASVTSLGSTQWWEIFLVCCFHFTFDLFFMATVSKFISHNLAGTNWQAQVAAVKRKFIIYVNSFCAICTVQQERHT